MENQTSPSPDFPSPQKPKQNPIVWIVAGAVILIIGVGIGLVAGKYLLPPQISSYEECVKANGGAIQPMYPSICTINGLRFTEPIKDEGKLDDKFKPQPFPQGFNNPDELMTKVLGAQYYTKHYQKVDEKEVSNDLIKVGYQYLYPPYLINYPMILMFNPKTGSISDKENSTVLLTPQEFKLSQIEAEKIAKSQQIYDCVSYSVKPELYWSVYTGIYNRFTWKVSGNTGCPKLTNENQGVVTKVILDVETGEIYATQKNEPAQIFDSQ